MEKRAFFLFPGQGAQYPGMALDFLKTGSARARELFALASDTLGRDMAKLLETSDAETLKRTDVSQPAITLANLAACAFLAGRGVSPAGCAGFSLGEYAALAAAGVLSEADCFALVKERGEAMQEAADTLAGADGDGPGMAAVLGLPPERAGELIARWKGEADAGTGDRALRELYAANINSSKQVVVSGTAGALAAAEGRFLEAGARRFVRLQVAGPFHSPLMAGAAERFRPFLEKTAFADPALPLFSNVTAARILTGHEAKKLAMEQITSPVRWVEEQRAILASGGFGATLEAGPGRVLAGLWKDTGSAVPCLAAGTVEECEAALSALR
jgi:[acyl-carrier-protein] S-malonyltransferase